MQVTLRPSFTISPSTSFEHHQISKFTNWSSPRGVTRATKGVIVPSSAVNNVKTTSSNARSADMLFTWVIVACIGLGLLMVLAISMGFFYWRLRRRKRNTTATRVGKERRKDRKRGRTNLRNSIKRVFVSEGPLYAVSNLSNSCYTGLPEGPNKPSASNSVRSSPGREIVTSHEEDGCVSPAKKRILYQRYLSPIEGVPPSPKWSASPVAKSGQDETYLKPIDELRASKRFLQRAKYESPEPSDDEYLQPLHGVPVSDESNPQTSTPKLTASKTPQIKPKP